MSPKTATLVFVATALGLLALMAAQVKREGGQTALGRATTSVTDPISGGALSTWRAVTGVWTGYVGLLSAHREKGELTARIARLEAELSRTRELEVENRRLRQLLDVTTAGVFEQAIVARVIASLGDGATRHAVVVDRGRRQGVDAGWVMLQGGAVAGRVVKAHFARSEVLLILDPDSGVSVRHQEGRFAGILRGGASGASRIARLDYVPRDAAVAVGDILVTAGIDGIYPPGLAVGRISHVQSESALMWSIRVETDFDPASLEEVLLIPPYAAPPPEPSETAPPEAP